MKIALKVTVEMTPEQVEDYCLLEGVDRNEIRDDIRRYVEAALQDAPSLTAGAAEVSVKP
jgi:hypothetical protein